MLTSAFKLKSLRYPLLEIRLHMYMLIRLAQTHDLVLEQVYAHLIRLLLAHVFETRPLCT